MDVYRRDSEVILHIDLPGILLKDVSVEVEDGWVSVAAERQYSPEPTDTVYLAERPYGRLVRRVRVGSFVDPASVKAELAHGVLTVTLASSSDQAKTRVTILDGNVPGEEK